MAISLSLSLSLWSQRNGKNMTKFESCHWQIFAHNKKQSWWHFCSCWLEKGTDYLPARRHFFHAFTQSWHFSRWCRTTNKSVVFFFAKRPAQGCQTDRYDLVFLSLSLSEIDKSKPAELAVDEFIATELKDDIQEEEKGEKKKKKTREIRSQIEMPDRVCVSALPFFVPISFEKRR